MRTSAHVLGCVAERHLFLFNLTIFKYIRMFNGVLGFWGFRVFIVAGAQTD